MYSLNDFLLWGKKFKRKFLPRILSFFVDLIMYNILDKNQVQTFRTGEYGFGQNRDY